MSAKHVLSGGQCPADDAGMRRMFAGQLGAAVTAADTADEALAALRGGAFDLVVINRVLDHDGSSGLDLVGRIKADPQLAGVPVMLVSNHEDAQREAVAQGALAGFGKAALGQPHTLARLRAALG